MNPSAQNPVWDHTIALEAEAPFSIRSSHVLDRLAVTFDDDLAVASAGLVLPAVLAGRLGVEALAEELVDLGDEPGAWPSRSQPLT